MKFCWINYHDHWTLLVLILFCCSSFRCQGNTGVIRNNQKLENSSTINSQLPTDQSRKNKKDKDTSPLPITSSPRTPTGIILTKHNYKYYSNTPHAGQNVIVTAAQSPMVTFPPQVPTQRPSNVPILKDIQTIVDILKQNKSEENKVHEIVEKLNLKGNLTKINVIHLKRNTSAYGPTFPKHVDHRNYSIDLNADDSVGVQKGSKELKVQFVLDCDLKNALNKDKAALNLNPAQILPERYPHPGEYQKLSYYYPTSPVLETQKRPGFIAYGIRKPQPQYTFVRTTTKAPEVKTKQKIKYVDPPAISVLSNTFENVYNFFEEALTDNVIFKKPPTNKLKKPATNQKHKINGNDRRKANRRPVRRPMAKRSTSFIGRVTPTSAPSYRYTPSAQHKEAQQLTTKIHVTSEYVAPEPKPDVIDSDSDSDDREPDSYEDSDEDEYYYDSLSFNSLGSEEDDSYEDDDDYNDDSISQEYDENVLPTSHKHKSKKGAKSKKIRRNKNSKDYNDRIEDYEDDDYSMPDFKGFFSDMFSSVGSYMPSIPFINGNEEDEEDDVDDGNKLDEGRSTTPRGELRKPKKPSYKYYKDYLLSNVEEVEKRKHWYNPFFYDSSEDDTSTTPLTPTTTESGFFDWFMGSGEELTQSTQASATEAPNPNWIAGLFGFQSSTTSTTSTTTTTTTTPAPSALSQSGLLSIVNPLQSPNQWLSFLAGHMATGATHTQQPSSSVNALKPQRAIYNNYQLWRLIPSTQNQIDYLREFKESSDSDKIHWLKGPALRGPTDILIPPQMIKEIKDVVEYESIPYDIRIWDLGKAIQYENPPMSIRQKIELDLEQGHPMTWFRYHEYEDITRFLDYLQHNFPSIVELIHIGRSFEGRPLIVVKISFDGYEPSSRKNKKNTQRNRKKKKTSKPGIFIEAGVHGREWITPAVATWILKELVKHHNKTDATSSEKEVIRSVDWYILPVSNPDGYEYSLKFDRMWRKTRSRHLDNKKSVLSLALNWLHPNKKDDRLICYGTDPDRNYEIEWNKRGASESECSDFYSGPKSLSEPETKALSNFLMENRKSLDIFLSLHSYGQMISFPSAPNASLNMHKANDELLDMAEVAVGAVRELATSGRYSIDQNDEMLDHRSGTSTEFAMYKVGLKYSYTMELRDTGTQGFLLAPSYIDSTGREIFEMIQAMADYL